MNILLFLCLSSKSQQQVTKMRVLFILYYEEICGEIQCTLYYTHYALSFGCVGNLTLSHGDDVSPLSQCTLELSQSKMLLDETLCKIFSRQYFYSSYAVFINNIKVYTIIKLFKITSTYIFIFFYLIFQAYSFQRIYMNLFIFLSQFYDIIFTIN